MSEKRDLTSNYGGYIKFNLLCGTCIPMGPHALLATRDADLQVQTELCEESESDKMGHPTKKK